MSLYVNEPEKKNLKNVYKEIFKKHRRRPDDPHYIDDINEIVDFSIQTPTSDSRIIDLTIQRYPCCQAQNDQQSANAATNYHGPIYGLKTHPGFAYIPSALSPDLQRDLAYRALVEFCEEPHGTNIDLVPLKEGIEIQNSGKEETLWELWKKENNFKESNIVNDQKDNNPEKIQIENQNNCSDRKRKRYYKCFDKLSWATLGYRFDWTARAYREKNKSSMPVLMDKLGKFFAKLGEEVNPEATEESIKNYSFTASAAIVNYYSLKSSMGGHRDDSELDITKPVVSFSLGLPAVFMIGSKSREEGPVVPLLLRPGDMMLLGGESRLNYHGVARILTDEVKIPQVGTHIGGKRIRNFQINSWNVILGDANVDTDTPLSDYKAIEKFLLEYRINANVRQVLPDGVDRIPGDEDIDD